MFPTRTHANHRNWNQCVDWSEWNEKVSTGNSGSVSIGFFASLKPQQTIIMHQHVVDRKKQMEDE